METALLAAPALAVLLLGSEPVFGRGTQTDMLLVLAGAVTAAPLLMFAAAARRLREMIRDDYVAGRTVKLSGWLLSRTEGCIFARIAMCAR